MDLRYARHLGTYTLEAWMKPCELQHQAFFSAFQLVHSEYPEVQSWAGNASKQQSTALKHASPDGGYSELRALVKPKSLDGVCVRSLLADVYALSGSCASSIGQDSKTAPNTFKTITCSSKFRRGVSHAAVQPSGQLML